MEGQSSTGGGAVRASRYGESLFRSANDGEQDRLLAMAGWLDPTSRERLSALGVGAGWRCLDVGSGPGTVARWLARRGCEVVALDRDVRFLDEARDAGVRVVQADLFDEEFDPGEFDLVHARTVLMHLRERERALRRLVTWVRPGGWLMVGDPVDLGTASSPDADFRRVMAALWRALAQVIGTDINQGRRYPGVLAERGLSEIGAEVDVPALVGGGAQAQFWRLTLGECRGAIAASAMVEDEAVERVLRYLETPSTWDVCLGLITAWGRRP